MVCLAPAALAEPAHAASRCSGTGWLGAWATSPAHADTAVLEDQTLRLVVNPTAGGRVVRVRISNHFGSMPLRLGGVTIARRASGAAVVPATLRRLTFDGRRRPTIAPGATATSDAARLRVRAFRDLAISVHVRQAGGGVTRHPFAFQTSYLGAAPIKAAP